MNRRVVRWKAAALAGAVALMASGCSTSVDSGSGPDGVVKVGLVTSVTGSFAPMAKSFRNGFEAGLDYLTGGTAEVNGIKIEVVVRDDKGDPATGVTEAKTLLGEGVKIITGPTNSAVALAVAQLVADNGGTYLTGASGTTQTIGMHRSVFNTGGTGLNANLALIEMVGSGKKLVAVGQDYEYGQSVVADLGALAESRGVEFDSILLPTDTNDFTPAMVRLRDMQPDVVYNFWGGDGSNQLFGAMKNGGIFDIATVTGMLTVRGTWPAFIEAAGAAVSELEVLSPYFEGAADENPAQTALLDYAKRTGVEVDYVHPTGFIAASMVVRAVQEAGAELEQAAVAKALEGWTINSPVGELTIRAEDHMLTTPYFAFKLSMENGVAVATRTRVFPAADLVAPVTKPIP